MKLEALLIATKLVFTQMSHRRISSKLIAQVSGVCILLVLVLPACNRPSSQQATERNDDANSS